MEKIQVKHIKELQNAREDFTLINVLSEEMFEEEHIPGSINIPLEEGNFVQEVESVVPSKAHKIIVYCAGPGCTASKEAAKKLDKAGFSFILCFEGGMEEWKKAGEEVEKV